MPPKPEGNAWKRASYRLRRLSLRSILLRTPSSAPGAGQHLDCDAPLRHQRLRRDRPHLLDGDAFDLLQVLRRKLPLVDGRIEAERARLTGVRLAVQGIVAAQRPLRQVELL